MQLSVVLCSAVHRDSVGTILHLQDFKQYLTEKWRDQGSGSEELGGFLRIRRVLGIPRVVDPLVTQALLAGHGKGCSQSGTEMGSVSRKVNKAGRSSG